MNDKGHSRNIKKSDFSFSAVIYRLCLGLHGHVAPLWFGVGPI